MDNNLQDRFIEIIKQHEGLIYKVCTVYTSDSETCKDMFQEIVLQAWSAYPRFGNNAKVSTWLYRIALNTAITHLRKEKKHASTSKLDDQLQFYAHVEHQRDEEYKMMHKLIEHLPPLDKALILLYLEDKSHAEISDILGISNSNVSTRLMRIREKLKKQVRPLFQ